MTQFLPKNFIYRYLFEKKPHWGGLVSLKTLAQCVMDIPITTENKRKSQKVVLPACCFSSSAFNFLLQHAEEYNDVMPDNRYD